MADLSEKLFLEEIGALADDLRREIFAHQIGLDPSPPARLARRKRVLIDHDFAFFAYTYFPHHMRPPASCFQRQFFDRFPRLLAAPGGVKEWWIAPRGEGKSSLMCKIGACYVAVLSLLQTDGIRQELGWHGAPPHFIDYVILLGAETRLPTKLLEVVKTELTINASLALDFPEACGQGKQWKIGEFVSAAGVKFESFGAEQAVRGTFHGASRPKLLLGDDLITDKEAKSPTERDNRWDWLERAIDYLGPPDGSVKFLCAATVLNKDDPVSRAKKTIGHLVHHFRALETLPRHLDLWQDCQQIMIDEDAHLMADAAERGEVVTEADMPSYRFYLANRVRMDDGAITSWPEVRSLYQLMRQRAKNARAFATEMQGDPRSDEDRFFHPVHVWITRSDRWLMFAACDPSVGRKKTSHPSAILVGGWDRMRSRLNVISAEIKRRVPSKLESDLIRMQQEDKPIAIGFENNNAFEIQRQTIIREGLRQGVALPLIGITAVADRESRISSLETYITDEIEPKILFSAGLTNLLDELDTWPEPPNGHDYDGLSALHILWMIAVTRSTNPSDGFRSAGRRTPKSGGGDEDDDPQSYRSRRMF